MVLESKKRQMQQGLLPLPHLPCHYSSILYHTVIFPDKHTLKHDLTHLVASCHIAGIITLQHTSAKKLKTTWSIGSQLHLKTWRWNPQTSPKHTPSDTVKVIDEYLPLSPRCVSNWWYYTRPSWLTNGQRSQPICLWHSRVTSTAVQLSVEERQQS